MNVNKSSGHVLAAVDVDRLHPAVVFDLEDMDVFENTLEVDRSKRAFLEGLRNEGVVGILGSIPTSAVLGIVKVKDGTNSLDATALDAAIRGLFNC